MSELIDREAVRKFIKSYRHSTDVAFDMEKHLDEIPAAPCWHRVEEPPIEYQRCMVYSSETRQMVSGVWTAEYGWMIPGPIGKLTHWMPIEPPKEDNERL